MFHYVENRRLAKCLKHWAYSLFQVYKLRRENAKPENMCDIVFEKTKGRGGAVNRRSTYAEAAVQRVLLKKSVTKYFGELTRKYLRRNLFLDKVKLVDPQPH